jgi:hypothetical protein
LARFLNLRTLNWLRVLMSGLGCEATISACFAGTAREQLPNRPLEEYRAAVAPATARGLLATHSSIGPGALKL